MLTKGYVIKKCIERFGNKYDYSKLPEIINSVKEKIHIICPIHGEFILTVHQHTTGIGCRKCADEKRWKNRILTTEDFILKAKKIHGDKYDYSKVVFVNMTTKVCIICPEHGEFWMTPSAHLSYKRGCSKCSKPIFDTTSFIKKAREIHGDKYDYSKVEYINSSTKVCIICPEHGEFWQTPVNHTHKTKPQGCPICGFNEQQKINQERKEKAKLNFIEKARNIHGSKFDYSKSEYKGAHTKVCIMCPEHGEFWMTPDKHINAKEKCPRCKETKLEKEIRETLEKYKINFIYEYSPKFLKRQRYDFYLPDFNVAIECQGIQHYRPISFGNHTEEEKNKNFQNILRLDEVKRIRSRENGIGVLYFTSSDLKVDTEFINAEELIKYILLTKKLKFYDRRI